MRGTNLLVQKYLLHLYKATIFFFNLKVVPQFVACLSYLDSYPVCAALVLYTFGPNDHSSNLRSSNCSTDYGSSV